MQGTFVTETLGYDSGRRVTVYVPPSRPQAFVFAADGEAISKWGHLLEAATDLAIPPTMIIGVHGASGHGHQERRLHEYSPVFDAQRFAAHEQFFVHDVRSWVESRFQVSISSAKATAVYGASAGAEFALAAGLKHPHVFGAVLGASPGAGYRPPETWAGDPKSAMPRVYLVVGKGEPFFMENAQRWARALGEAGADVVFKERDGGHGGDFWKLEFPRMAAWAFSDSL